LTTSPETVAAIAERVAAVVRELRLDFSFRNVKQRLDLRLERPLTAVKSNHARRRSVRIEDTDFSTSKFCAAFRLIELG
jgi:hypothetical protein